MIASRTRDLRKITTSILNLLAKGTVGAGSHLLLAENMLPVRSFNMCGERSMTYAERIAAYQPVYGTMTKRFEPTGDHARAAQAMIQAVGADVPPLRLALGADALHLVREKLNSELEEYKRWESVTVATAFEDSAQGALDTRK